jgi:sarcosine oxidase subunit beta
MAQWAALCDMTPDFSPMMGVTRIGVCSSSRRGTYGFQAGLAAGEAMTKLIAMGKTPELLAASDLARFADGRFVGEKGAAAVGH